MTSYLKRSAKAVAGLAGEGGNNKLMSICKRLMVSALIHHIVNQNLNNEQPQQGSSHAQTRSRVFKVRTGRPRCVRVKEMGNPANKCP